MANTTVRPARKYTETKVLAADLKVGDVFWFSGCWCTFTRFIDLKVMARFPYTPAERDVWMMSLRTPEGEASDWAKRLGPQTVTVKTLNPAAVEV